MNLSKVLIYGAGMMGKGVAQVFSQCNEAEILLFDVAENFEALGPIENNLKQLCQNGLLEENEIKNRMARISQTGDLQKVREFAPDIVVECVFENMELKQKVFAQLEEVCSKKTVFCTNTSVMSPTEISQFLKYKNRFVGTHFWNPAALIPLVEVVKTNETDDEVANAVVDLLNKAGKKAVLCNKDVPGFIANRMQHALWREALYIVEQGIADAQTVDIAVRNSFGLRLPQLGPLENADMVGMDLTYNIHEYILPYLCHSKTPSSIVCEKIEKGELGFKTGKGLQEWPEEKANKSRNDLNEYLIRMQKANK